MGHGWSSRPVRSRGNIEPQATMWAFAFVAVKPETGRRAPRLGRHSSSDTHWRSQTLRSMEADYVPFIGMQGPIPGSTGSGGSAICSLPERPVPHKGVLKIMR